MNYTPILLKSSENRKIMSYIFKLNYLLQSFIMTFWELISEVSSLIFLAIL